jgi:hypothetical protein
MLKNKKVNFSGKMDDDCLVVHIVADENGKKICDLKLSTQEVLNLVEYAIKDIFGRLEKDLKEEGKEDVL